VCREENRRLSLPIRFNGVAPPSRRFQETSRGTYLVWLAYSHARLCATGTMSALGCRPTCPVQDGMSASPLKADIRASGQHIRYGPKPEIASSLRRHWHGKNGRLPDQRSASRTQDLGARRSRRGDEGVRRKSERERAEYARGVEVLIDSETPEDTEDRAAQLRRGPGGSGCGFSPPTTSLSSASVKVIACSLFVMAIAPFG
jgi:hypothetical protein